MKRLYGDLKMSWLTVLLFAIAAGVYTGIVMMIPFLENTSFQDIGISYEWWVIFAVIIVVNCDKGWEAMLKCFVFFLVSQPVIFGVEVIFGDLPLSQAWYYYSAIWFKATLLTLPGGFIAYFCKKQNFLGSAILGLGNTIQAGLGVYYLGMAVRSFPHHLLSGLICIASIIVMSVSIQKQKKYRWVSILLPVVLVAVIAVLSKATGRTLFA